MHRFFVPPEAIVGQEARLGAELARRMARVLRLRPGDHVLLLNNAGREFEVELTALTTRAGHALILASREGAGEPNFRLVLYQALIKGQRFDWVLEKGTELGVAAFVPVVSSRSVVRPIEATAARRERWRRVIVEAAEQSGRSRLPEISPPLPFADACASAGGLRILPWEGESAASLSDVLAAERPVDAVSLFIGPEGGFPPEEVELARQQGVRTVSLGRRILRAETAAIAAAALVLNELGELNR
ncbi:MAG: 16S rRNA (uracil(1498)-N(3))-methyltransferase [Dehalococcoidia bacterium]